MGSPYPGLLTLLLLAVQAVQRNVKGAPCDTTADTVGVTFSENWLRSARKVHSGGDGREGRHGEGAQTGMRCLGDFLAALVLVGVVGACSGDLGAGASPPAGAAGQAAVAGGLNGGGSGGAVAGAGGSSGDGVVAGRDAGGAPQASEGPLLRILQLNVWQEGTEVEGGLAKIAAVILATHADVAAFSEVRNYDGQDWTTKLLAELKAQAPERDFFGRFAGGDVGLISRYPIGAEHLVFDETDVDAGSIMAWTLAIPGGAPLTVASAHLDYQHYALNWVRGYEGGGPSGWGERPNDGMLVHETDAHVLLEYNRESRRDEAISAFREFAGARPDGEALVLCGDFNEGSDLDWTEQAKNEPSHYGAVIPWDNSLLLANSGFRDAYRAVHVDALQYPGFTWPAPADGKTTTTWAPEADERDRIDFIYVPENVIAREAWVVGPSTTFVGTNKLENPGLDTFLAGDMPWPSDHKGVLVSVSLAPAP